MQVATGMTTAAAFLLVGGASAAFVLGGLMVFSTLLLSLAQPLPLVIVFSTSSFLFICVALMELFGDAQNGFMDFLISRSWSDPTASGLAQLFATSSMVLGVIMLYATDAVIYRVSIMAADCYGEASLPQRHHAGGVSGLPRGSFSQLNLAASMYSIDLRLGTSHVQTTQPTTRPYDRYNGAAELAEMSASSSSSYEPFSTQATSVRLRGTLLSATAVMLHHMPEGLALYVSAVGHFHIGVAVAVGVALHSLPDGIALASSIYFASGHRVRGVLWCLLAPLGKLSGALMAWFLVGFGHQDDGNKALTRAIFTGVTAGILLGVGVKEVMPTTHNYAVGKTHGAIIGIISGMLVVAASKFITYQS